MKPFLSAIWRDLIVLNYEADPALLLPHLPAGTELDLWQGRALISLVAFRFLNTRVWSLPIPFHTNFLELNLRFYVKRQAPEGLRRGVVFLKELVPRFAIAALARLLFNENYHCARMNFSAEQSDASRTLNFGWRHQGQAHQLKAKIQGAPTPLPTGSEAEFTFEHYWGYSKQRNGGTIEYAVEHVPWRIWPALLVEFSNPAHCGYGVEFDRILCAPPASVLVAEVLPSRSIEVRRSPHERFLHLDPIHKHGPQRLGAL